MNYEKRAIDFLADTKTTMKAEYLDHAPYFGDEDNVRDIWRIVLKRNGKTLSFKFGNTVNSGREPTAYDVLACLVKSDPGTFENFCGDYGYAEDSRKVEKIYKTVVKEYAGVKRLFAGVIDQLAEIA